VDYISPDYLDVILNRYNRELLKVKKIKQFSLLVIGISGTWWIWFFGVHLFREDGDFEYLFLAFLATIIILTLSSWSADQSYSKKSSLVRIMAIFGIVNLHFNDVNTIYSIIFFTYGVILEDTINPIVARLHRTHKLNSLSNISELEIPIIQSDTNYIEDRVTWAVKTTTFVLILGCIALFGILLITRLTSILNAKFIQYVSLVSIIILGTILIPKILPDTIA
jgi:hypothetical protein